MIEDEEGLMPNASSEDKLLISSQETMALDDSIAGTSFQLENQPRRLDIVSISDSNPVLKSSPLAASGKREPTKISFAESQRGSRYLLSSEIYPYFEQYYKETEVAAVDGRLNSRRLLKNKRL